MQNGQWLISGLLLLGLLVFEAVLWWLGSPREEILAVHGILVFLVWLAIVFVSLTPLASKTWYRLLFESNDRRWCWLAGLTFIFFIACAVMGRGQPLIRGVEEGLANTLSSSPVKETKSILWRIFENQIPDEFKPVPKADDAQREPTQRPFYGLRSWSHWFVFIFLYLPTLFFYGVAAKREEVAAWAERRLEDRELRLRHATQTQGAGASQPVNLGLFLIEFLAVVLGTIAASRIIRWMERRKA